MLSFPELGFGGNSLLSNARANGNLLGCLGGLQAAYSAQHTKGDCSMAGTRVVLHTPHTAPSLQTPKWKLLCISDTQGTMLLHPMYTLCHWNTHIFLLNNAAGTKTLPRLMLFFTYPTARRHVHPPHLAQENALTNVFHLR